MLKLAQIMLKICSNYAQTMLKLCSKQNRKSITADYVMANTRKKAG